MLNIKGLNTFCLNIATIFSLNKIKYFIIALGLLLPALQSIAQVRVSGKVYDISGKIPMEAVSVLSNSGKGTTTDMDGRYTIVLDIKDSIWFSYLNKPTLKYAVELIPNRENFEIAIHVSPSVLKEIHFRPHNYRMDSLQNRIDYARAFNYRKPGIGSSLNIGPNGGVGLDINELIGMFQFRKNRRMESFQERLIREEEEKYIDHRFSRALVIRLTGLRGIDLDTFMVRYRPIIEFTREASDYDFQEYIKKCFHHFSRMRRMEMQLRKPED